MFVKYSVILLVFIIVFIGPICYKVYIVSKTFEYPRFRNVLHIALAPCEFIPMPYGKLKRLLPFLRISVGVKFPPTVILLRYDTPIQLHVCSYEL